MPQTGPANAITDVPGVTVGHYTDRAAASGCTVVLTQDGAVAGVDVRGAAPGTRETDLLDPVNLVREVQGVVLSGGSVFGLSAAHGAVKWLAERGKGFPLEKGHVAPIVPSAVLYDLGRGEQFIPPVDSTWGYKACEAASSEPPQMGCFGAGTGAMAMAGSFKGGIGTASEVLESGITVGAIVAVNALGSVINPATGLLWEIGLEIGEEFGPLGKTAVRPPGAAEPRPGANTTIGVVATDAILTKAEARKTAQTAHDGLARAIRPAHTIFDGDTIFCLATGKKPLPEIPGFFAAPNAVALNDIGRAAADTFSRAVIRAVLAAESLYGAKAYKDLEKR